MREGHLYLVTSARDMTDANRQRLEHEAIMANASVGLAHIRNRQFVMVNPRFEQMYGWPAGQLVGQSARVVWCDDAAFAGLGAEILPALRRGEQVDIERTRATPRWQPVPGSPAGPSGGPLAPGERRHDLDRRGCDFAAPGSRRAGPRQGGPPRPPAAPRVPSWPTTSHELRTPLNGLVGLARLARQPNVPAERLQSYLEQIGGSAETLSMIISDILDLSKIEAGRLEVESAPFDLLGLLHSLQQAYTALAASHGLCFEVDIAPNVPAMVQGDALRVRQVLANYLHNALKFTAQAACG